MRYAATRTLGALVVALVLGAPAAPALDPMDWDPAGQPAEEAGYLCHREVDDGSEYGIWVDPRSRSRAYRRLELPASVRLPGALAYAHPYDVSDDYWQDSAKVLVEGTFLGPEAIEPTRISGAASWSAGDAAASLDEESLAQVLMDVAAGSARDPQAEALDRRSMTRLLQRGLASRLARALAGGRR